MTFSKHGLTGQSVDLAKAVLALSATDDLQTHREKLARIVLDDMYQLPLLNFEWVGEPVFRWASGVKGGHGPAKRTLDAGCTPATLG